MKPCLSPVPGSVLSPQSAILRLTEVHKVIAIVVIGTILTACGGGTAPAVTVTPGGPATPNNGAVVVTSSAPTSTPSAVGSAFPKGTLILMQHNIAIAQTPNRQTVAISDDRFGARGAPNGRYGVKITHTDKIALSLVDYSTNPPSTKDIPQGNSLNGPGITWKQDSSGFAFFDFPTSEKAATAAGGVFYFDLASGQTKQLIAAPKDTSTVTTSFAFSPDGKYLLYAVSKANAESTGGPGSQPFILDTTTNQSTPVATDVITGFNQWLKDGSGFLVLKGDPNTGSQSLLLYTLAALTQPKTLTPAKTSDFLVDLAPDGKRLIVTSTPAGQTNTSANIFMMNLDGSNRKQLTKFTTVDQSVTGLAWAADGIYYSLYGKDIDSTWRMDLDGSNVTQIADGTLNAVIGS